MARNSRPTRLPWEDWKAWAVPVKLVTMEEGSVARAASFTAATASLSATPSPRLKEMETEGSWPEWFTVSGPAPDSDRASAERGTVSPVCAERT